MTCHSRAVSLGLVFATAVCLAQLPGTVGAYKVDFAVPDMPAFKALGADPSELLRPSDPKAFALMLADQTSTFRLIPQSFAAEFAPARLFSAGKLTVGEYTSHAALYNARVSLGSLRRSDSTGGSAVAGGVRMTLGNSSDFVRHVVDLRDGVYGRASRDFRQANRARRDSLPDTTFTRLQNDYADSLARDSVDRRIGPIRDKYRDNWNGSTFDVAYAISFESPDSFTHGLAPARHLAWISWSLPVVSWLQGVAGANGAYSRPDSAWVFDYSGALRLAGGINEFKLNLDGQYKHDGAEGRTVWLVGFGAEVMVFSGGWVDFALNWEKDATGGGVRFVPGIKYRYTMPESFTRF